MNAVVRPAPVAARDVPENSLELADRASGRTTELPVRNGALGPGVIDLASIHRAHGVFAFDPGFGLTASWESRVTYIDGEAGLLLYRGYAPRQLYTGPTRRDYTDIAMRE